MLAGELWVHVVDEHQLRLVLVDVLLQDDIGDGAHHLQRPGLAARAQVGRAQHLHHEAHRLLQHLFALGDAHVQQALRRGDGTEEFLKHI